MTRIFTPPPTIGRYLLSQKRVQLLLGPIGGGKTTGVLMKLLALAHMQAPNASGVRKTRWAVVRNTRPQLRDSVLKSVFDWLPPDGRFIQWHETDMNLRLNLPLPDGTFLECEIMFRPLDDESDARRLLSVEYTGVWLSEFREIPHQLLTDCLSRTGRFPSAADGGCTWHGVLGESNMPTRGSDWHRYIELERPTYCDVFIQPAGTAPDAENTDHLPPDYYSVLMEGAKQNWIQAHILCEYPDSLDGKAVHGASYNYERHVSKVPIGSVGHGGFAPTVIMGVDQGRSPAAVFCQMHNGTLYVLKEVFAQNIGMEQFALHYLRPLVAQYFTGLSVLAVIDPAGMRKNEVNDDTPADALRRTGFRVIPAPTNDIKRRLDAVDRLLLAHRGMVINPECTTLINALASEYRFKTKKNGELDDVAPEKRHPISDVCDALQYAALIAGGDNYGRVMRRFSSRDAEPAPPVTGWT